MTKKVLIQSNVRTNAQVHIICRSIQFALTIRVGHCFGRQITTWNRNQQHLQLICTPERQRRNKIHEMNGQLITDHYLLNWLFYWSSQNVVYVNAAQQWKKKLKRNAWPTMHINPFSSSDALLDKIVTKCMITEKSKVWPSCSTTSATCKIWSIL